MMPNFWHLPNKVHIFWEGHKILRNLHRRFDPYYIDKSTVEISQKFVAFSEYMNFTITRDQSKSNRGQIITSEL